MFECTVTVLYEQSKEKSLFKGTALFCGYFVIMYITVILTEITHLQPLYLTDGKFQFVGFTKKKNPAQNIRNVTYLMIKMGLNGVFLNVGVYWYVMGSIGGMLSGRCNPGRTLNKS